MTLTRNGKKIKKSDKSDQKRNSERGKKFVCGRKPLRERSSRGKV